MKDWSPNEHWQGKNLGAPSAPRRIAKPLSVSGILLALLCSLPSCGGVEPLPTVLGRGDWMASKWDAQYRETQKKLASLRDTLTTLAPASPHDNQGVCIGYHSEFSTSADNVKEFRLDLNQIQVIDSIVLVPAQILGVDGSLTGYGFPQRFRVEIAEEGSFKAPKVLGDFTASDFPNPGRLPVALDAGGMKGRFVRIVVTRLTGGTNHWFFALGEVFVFGGERNLALGLFGMNIDPTDSFGNPPAWLKSNSVDGQSGLGPAVDTGGSPTIGWRSESSETESISPWVCLDLGRAFSLDEVRIHPAQPQDSPRGAGYAFPKGLVIEGALDADFTSPVSLFQTGGLELPVSGGNPVCIRVAHSPVRFLRVTGKKLRVIRDRFECAFSEVEAFSEGINVALGAAVKASSSVDVPQWSAAALSDGFNSNGRLVPLRPWLEELSQRRALEESERALESFLKRREAQWLGALGRIYEMAGITVLLLAALLWWRARAARARELELLRQRIARDLHDEIGSNLGTISMLSQMALESNPPDPQTRSDILEMGSLAAHSVGAIRDLVWLLKHESARIADFVAEMKITAGPLLQGIDWELEADPGSLPPSMSFTLRRDIFMAFKEILHNAAKHSGARSIRIQLSASGQKIRLSVADNGRGFDTERVQGGIGLGSLKARAAAAGGEVRFQSRPAEGTLVVFELPLHSQRKQVLHRAPKTPS